MHKVEEFMHAYFRERLELRKAWVANSAPFRAKFFTTDYAWKHRRSEDEVRSQEKEKPESILSVEANEESATVITSEPLGSGRQRFRYLLQSSGAGWLIHRHEWECFLCNGTGRRGEIQCDSCDGKGWHHHGPSDT